MTTTTPKQEEREALKKQKHMEKMARAAAEKREKDAKKARWARMKELRAQIAYHQTIIDDAARRYDKILSSKSMDGLETQQARMLRNSEKQKKLKQELDELARD